MPNTHTHTYIYTFTVYRINSTNPARFFQAGPVESIGCHGYVFKSSIGGALHVSPPCGPALEAFQMDTTAKA